MLVKLPFILEYASDWDEDFPPTNILPEASSQSTAGWHTPRFCTYPQHIIIRLKNGPTRIRNLQILSHHFKIASKIDIYAGKSSLENSSEGPTFKRLGYTILDDNSRSEYKARELKSIHVDCEAELIKFVIRDCYVNELNLYNQVGIIAITIVGENTDVSLVPDIKQNIQSNLSELVDDPGTLGVIKKSQSIDKIATTDEKMRMLIAGLCTLKEEVLAVENFQQAKVIKSLVDLFKKIAEDIDKLEIAKSTAVTEEDYDLAQKLKTDIQQLRQAVEQKVNDNGLILIENNGKLQVKLRKESALSESHGKPHKANRTIRTKSTPPPLISEPTELPIEKVLSLAPSKRSLEKTDSSRTRSTSPQEAPNKEYNLRKQEDEVLESQVFTDSSKPQIIDERPLPTIKKMNESPWTDEIPDKVFSDKIPTPEPLLVGLSGELGDAITIYGETFVSYLLSKKFASLEYGLAQLEAKMMSEIARLGMKGQDQNESENITPVTLIAGTTQVLSKILGDHREKVIFLTVGIMENLYEYAIEGKLPPISIYRSLDALFPTLVAKYCDSNVRIKKMLLDLILFIAKHFHNFIISSLLKPTKPSTMAKFVQGRIELFQKIIEELGKVCLNETEHSIEKFIEFGKQSLSNPNGKVRDAAVNFIVCIGKSFDEPPERIVDVYLKDVKPVLIESIQDKLGIRTEKQNKPEYQELQKEIDELREHLTQKATVTRFKRRTMTGTIPHPQPSPSRTISTRKTKTPSRGRTIRMEDKPKISANTTPTSSKRPISMYSKVRSVSLEAVSPTRNRSRPSTPMKAETSKPIVQKSDDRRLHSAASSRSEGDINSTIDNTCIFCDESRPEFSEDTLDAHYWSECPMLMNCPRCNQIVEICNLSDHLISDCETRHQTIVCDSCHIALLESLQEHIHHGHCQAKAFGIEICPLCHGKISCLDKDSGWKKHFLERPGCPCNPRTVNQHLSPDGEGRGSKIPRRAFMRPPMAK